MRWLQPRSCLLLCLCLVTIALPFFGNWLRSRSEMRCSLDGLEIAPLYRVRIVDRHGIEHAFCCIGCAVKWLERSEIELPTVYVTDEASGMEVGAGEAYFLHSATATNAITGNYLRAFRKQADAEAYLRVYGGQMVNDRERPFAK